MYTVDGTSERLSSVNALKLLQAMLADWPCCSDSCSGVIAALPVERLTYGIETLWVGFLLPDGIVFLEYVDIVIHLKTGDVGG